MIKIICLGKIKENYLNDLIDDYKKRISKYQKLEIIELKDTNILLEEASNIMDKIDNKDYVIALAIEGEEMDSVSFANLIDKTFISYPNITFVIGSSNGLDDVVKKRANKLLSFSRFTYPHGLFRGILLEQIYRACKINNNESYHK